MPQRKPMPKGYWTLWTTVALDLVGFGIVAPLLPLYAERFGASGLTTGLLFASFSAAQFVFAPVLGRWSDRVGRKPVILISLFGTAIGSFVTAAGGSLWVLFIGRVLDGASGASVSVAQGAVTDLAAPGDRPRLLGMLGAAFGVGFVIGPAIGGLASLGGIRLPFIVAGCIALVNAIVAIRRLPETHGRRARPTTGFVPQRSLQRLAAVGFLTTVAFGGFEAMFSRFGHDRFALTEGSVSVVFVVIGLWLVVVQGGIVGRVSARVDAGGLVRGGLVLLSIGMALLAAATTWWLLVPALALLATGQAVVAPSLTTLVADRADVATRGEALGRQQSASALARIVGPVAAGVLFDRGVALPYAVGAGLVGVALVVVMSATSRYLSPASARP